MTDPSRAHAQAIHDLLDAAVDYTVYFGGVTDSGDDLTYPYLVVWPPPAMRRRENLTGTVSGLTTTIQVTAAGQDINEVLAAMDRAATALQGVRPTIPGRSCGQIHQAEDFVPPPVAESNVTRTPGERPVYRGVDQYRLYSTPAASA